MNEHAAVAKDRVEAEAVRRRDRQDVERARDHHEHDQEEARDRAHDPGRVGGQARPEPRARQQRRAAKDAEDEGPVEQRSFLAAVEAGCHQRDRCRQVGVLGYVGEREIVRDQRCLEQRGCDENHRRRRVERTAADLDHHSVLDTAGPERKQSREHSHHQAGEQGT